MPFELCARRWFRRRKQLPFCCLGSWGKYWRGWTGVAGDIDNAGLGRGRGGVAAEKAGLRSVCARRFGLWTDTFHVPFQSCLLFCLPERFTDVYVRVLTCISLPSCCRRFSTCLRSPSPSFYNRRAYAYTALFSCTF